MSASPTSPSASAPATASAPAATDYQDVPFALFFHGHEKTSDKKVFAIFKNLGLGRLGRADGGEAIEMTERTNQEGRIYKTILVHFKHLFSRGENGAENQGIYEHLKANKDNFITVEHMPEKTLEDGTVLPARVWKPRMDRPRKPRADGAVAGVRPKIELGRVSRAPRATPALLDTSEDWGNTVHESARTEDEAREAVQAVQAGAATSKYESYTDPDGIQRLVDRPSGKVYNTDEEYVGRMRLDGLVDMEVADSENEGETELTDEEYARQVLAGASA